ncbi:MAG: hypothetical protein ACOX87_08245 [Chloroflexota bacterium]
MYGSKGEPLGIDTFSSSLPPALLLEEDELLPEAGFDAVVGCAWELEADDDAALLSGACVDWDDVPPPEQAVRSSAITTNIEAHLRMNICVSP